MNAAEARKRHFIMIGILSLLILAVNGIAIYYLGEGSGDGRVLRELVLAFYYMYYLGLGIWMNAGIVILASFVFLGGLKVGAVQYRRWKVLSTAGLIVFYLSLFFWLFHMGELKENRAELLLQLEYYGFLLFQSFSLGSFLRFRSKRSVAKPTAMENYEDMDRKLFKRLSVGFWIVLLGGIIPILAACPYIFPQADDWSLGWRTHLAFEETGSFLAALEAALVTVQTMLIEHTGTFFTLIVMSLHPGTFKESWYAATPFIFVGLILFSAWFFLREICIKWLKLDRSIFYTLTAFYCILVLQCMPTKASAFYWFNGAVNYILPHSLLLCLMVFTFRLYRGDRRWYNYLGAGITGICIGGGNLVTAVGCLVIFMEIYFLMTLFSKWKGRLQMLFPGLLFLLGFILNVAAPGNSKRISNFERAGLVECFVEAFLRALKYMLGEWMHWSLFLFIALVIPILWTVASRIKVSWRYPLLIILLGWGNVAGMFFAPLYATGHTLSGRYHNVMYMTWILWLLIAITCFFGWMKQKYQIDQLIYKHGRYYGIVLALGLICLVPSVMAEPAYYSASFSAKTILSGEAQRYAEIYGKNIEIMKTSPEKEVTLYELGDEPLLFTNSQIEVWHSGIRVFYQKEKLNFVPWDGE